MRAASFFARLVGLVGFVGLLAGPLGCAAGKSTLDVTVDSASPLANVDHLRVSVTDTGGRKAMEIDLPVVGGAIPPAQSFALQFASSVKGRVSVTVEAMPAAGTSPIGGDTQSVDIEPSHRTSLSLSLRAGAQATQLAFTAQPSDSAVAAAIKPPVQVTVQDSAGSPVVVDGVAVTLMLGTNPSGGALTGTLTTMTVGGVATFGDLQLDKTGDGYTLVAAADMLASAVSAPFKVTPPAWVASNNGLYGGNVQSVVIDPKHPATVYGATADAGVWKTIDGGANWVQTSTGLPVDEQVSSIAIDPVTTTTLYAMLYALGGSPNDGIYKTTDGGASWSKLPGTIPVASHQNGIIAVDPNTPQNVFVGAGRAISRSTDGGATFGAINTTSAFTYGQGVRGMVVNNVGELWLASYGDGIQFLPLNGSALTLVTGSAANPLPSGHSSCCYYTAIGVNPTDHNYVWVSRDSGAAGMQTYRTITSSTTSDWTALSAPIFYAFSFIQAPSGFFGYGLMATGVYSTTNGVAWSPISNTLAGPLTSIAAQADNSAVFVGANTGVYRYASNAWALLVNGLTANPITALTVDPKTVNILFTGLRNVGELRSADSGATWSPPPTAGAIMLQSGYDLTDIAVDETDDKLVYAAAASPYRSTDGGNTWAAVSTGFTSTAQTMAAAPSMSGTFYGAATGNAYSIAAGASSWTTAGSGLPATSASSALLVDPTAPLTVYDATLGGGIYRTSNGGAAWGAVNGGLTSLNVTSLAMNRTTPTTLLAGTSDKGLFASSDGTSWSPTGAGLPSPVVISAVAIARSNPMVVYVGTRGAGVFRSGDGGATFAADSAGLGSLYVTRLAIDPANAQLVYAGTIDGGIYKTIP